MLKALKRSIYLRMLISFTCVMLAVLLISMPVNMRSIQRSRDQYIESSLAKAGFFLDLLGYEMRIAQNQLLGLINDKSVNELVTHTQITYTTEQIRLILDIKDKIIAMSAQSRYIREITVFLPRQGHQIETRFSFEPIDGARYDEMIECVRAETQPFFELNGRWYTGFGKYHSGGDVRAYNFIVVIEWDAVRIAQTLLELNNPSIDAGQRAGGVLLIGERGGINLAEPGVDEHVRALLADLDPGTSMSAQGDGTFQLQNTPFIYIWRTSNVLRSRLVIYENEAALNQIQAFYRQSFTVLLVVALFSALIYATLMRQFIAKPLRELKEAFQQFERENFDPPIGIATGNDFHQLFSYFQRMVERTDQLIGQIHKQRVLVQDAQLKQLQSQINPHFLYNSLLCARNLIKMSNDRAAIDMLRHLASYYEYITREAFDEVLLGSELEHVRNYVRVQAIRFMNRLSIEFDPTPERCAEAMVPRLILQPLVENAFEHGLKERAVGALLCVRIEEDATAIRIEVEDNGEITDERIEWMRGLISDQTEGGEVSGLVNVHRRLRYRFGGESGLAFERGASGGLCVQLTIEQRKN